MNMMTLEKYYASDNEGASERDRKSRIKWLKGYRQDWMSDDQWLLCLFLNRLFRGFHHINAPINQCGQRSICINTRYANLATYDYDYLTKAVIMAHNWGVRLEIKGSGPGMVKMQLWKRHLRTGNVSEIIPTIEDMVEKYKDY